MNSMTIPPGRWHEWLTGLGRRHEGQPVKLEEGMRVLERNGSLKTIDVVEPVAGHRRICIDLTECGADPEIHYEVMDPVRVVLEQPEPCAGGWLRIEAADGSTTVLEFDVPVLPGDRHERDEEHERRPGESD